MGWLNLICTACKNRLVLIIKNNQTNTSVISDSKWIWVPNLGLVVLTNFSVYSDIYFKPKDHVYLHHILTSRGKFISQMKSISYLYGFLNFNYLVYSLVIRDFWRMQFISFCLIIMIQCRLKLSLFNIKAKESSLLIVSLFEPLSWKSC